MTRYSTNLTLLLVNILLIYVSGHSEVGNLAYFLLPNQDIASSKVSMNYLEQTINYINHYSKQLYYLVVRNSRHSLHVFPTCQLVNKLTQLNKKRNSGHVYTNPDKLMYCILHTDTPLRIRIVFARPNENAYHLLRNMQNASSIYDI